MRGSTLPPERISGEATPARSSRPRELSPAAPHPRADRARCRARHPGGGGQEVICRNRPRGRRASRKPHPTPGPHPTPEGRSWRERPAKSEGEPGAGHDSVQLAAADEGASVAGGEEDGGEGGARPTDSEDAADIGSGEGRRRNLPWAYLMQRVSGINVPGCPACGRSARSRTRTRSGPSSIVSACRPARRPLPRPDRGPLPLRSPTPARPSTSSTDPARGAASAGRAGRGASAPPSPRHRLGCFRGRGSYGPPRGEGGGVDTSPLVGPMSGKSARRTS